jgi:hypothetical protein
LRDHAGQEAAKIRQPPRALVLAEADGTEHGVSHRANRALHGAADRAEQAVYGASEQAEQSAGRLVGGRLPGRPLPRGRC